MNNLDFLQAMGNLPESYYSECLPKQKTVRQRQNPIWYSVAVSAACIGVVFAFGALFLRHDNISEPSNTTVSMLTETTYVQSLGMTSELTEECASASVLTTDSETTALTTEQTTIVITPAFSY